MDNRHIQLIAEKLNLPSGKVRNTLALLDDGATIPFIARYRKEATGSLDEVQVADIQKEAKRLTELEKRRESILQSIEEQGKLTDELRRRITATFDLTELEDLYLPYKRKRQTRGSKAREKGLEPLAQRIFSQEESYPPEQMAEAYLTDEVESLDDALQGARDIIAEWINEDEQSRNTVRKVFEHGAEVQSKVARGKETEGAKYRDYFDFNEKLSQCPSHRLLALLRGEEEGILRVIIEPEPEEAIFRLEKQHLKGGNPSTDQVKAAIEDGYKRLLAPSIETEFRRLHKSRADEEAIAVFANNLKQLLLAAPLGQQCTIGIDPGYRTGCKVVVLDANGDLLEHTTIYPHPPQQQAREAEQTLLHLADKYGAEAIAVGNGTAGRETMSLCRQIRFGRPMEIFMVNESGASIYSASEVAREEFPDKDVTVRGAVSIGRRLMDPLAELVKIDPKSIGVGQYQHDVNQTLLKESLDRTVESCVNSVGINLNTASKPLLTYVSGLGPSLAANIVQYRSEHGAFRSRRQLLDVPRMGAKAFEQCAGFLRIREAEHPLDNTAVHPESYHIVEKMARDLNCTIAELIADRNLRKRIDLKRYVTEQTGLPTLRDILKELEKPGLDPRGKAKSFEFAPIQNIDDLRPGMVVPGIVNNITNFGAFVDIGIKESGLVHISQLSDRYVKNPADVVSLNQEVQVKVLEVDMERKRIQLSMKL